MLRKLTLEKSKQIAARQYPGLSEDNDNFQKMSNSIYQNMIKSKVVDTPLMKKSVELSFLCPEIPKDKRNFILDNYFLLKAHRAELRKSYKLQGKMNFQGLKISIENKKGSIRKWHDPLKDEDGQTKMKFPYGYINLTEGADGEHVDCYIGEDKEAGRVYVVRQKSPKTGKYDEDKVMLGFNTADEAKDAYIFHYNDPKFFGSIDEYNIETFKRNVKSKKGKVTGGELRKANYTKEDLAAKNMRWVTIRGNHVLVQGLDDGSYVVVGGAGGKMNHFKIDKLLSKEEYQQQAKERKEAKTKDITPEEIKEQAVKRKEEVKAKRSAKSDYDSMIRDIVGISSEDFKSNLTGKDLDEIEKVAIERVKKKKGLDQVKKESKLVEDEKEKVIEEKEADRIKDLEAQAVDVIAKDFFNEDMQDRKKEIRELVDPEKALEILKARKDFRKKIKDIGISKLDKGDEIKIGKTFASDSQSIKDDILEEVKQNIETRKNVELYENLSAQSLNAQRQIDMGILNTLNGVSSDLFGTSAVFGQKTVESLGLEALVNIIALKLKSEGKEDVAREAIAAFARKNNHKIVSDALSESKRRFAYADKIRKMAGEETDPEAILSRASANGYALRQILKGQQAVGTAVGSLRSVAHLLNRLEEGTGNVIQVDMGKNLAMARKKAKKAGFLRKDYKMTSNEGRFIMELKKEALDGFFNQNQSMRQEETRLDKIKKHEENSGYKPKGVKDSITLDPAQEAGLLFFKECGKVLLDFEAGIGKTAVGYAGAMEAMESGGVKKVLVVTPAKLRDQMYQERKVFLDEDKQKLVTLNDKTKKFRDENYQKDGITIIGHDQLRTDAEAIKAAGYGMIIVDEIHEITSPEVKGKADSGRFKGLMSLKDIPYKIGMSGTNIKHSKVELYKKVNFLDPNHTLGTLKDFESRYKGLNQGSGVFQDSSNNAFRNEVSPWVYTQKSNLPVKNNIVELSIPLTSTQKKLYKESEKKYVAERNRKSKGAAARRDSRNYNIIHNGSAPGENSKIQEIINKMENKHKDGKAVIHVYRRKALGTMQRALEKKYGVESVGLIHGDTSKAQANRIKSDYNNPDGKTRFIIGTKSLESGHNLQHGGTVTFHLDIPISAAAFDQRNKRVYRKGQDKNTTSYILRSDSPFDFSKMDIMERKGKEMKILDNPRHVESLDDSGFISIANGMEKE